MLKETKEIKEIKVIKELKVYKVLVAEDKVEEMVLKVLREILGKEV